MLKINEETCIGCGICASSYPDTFVMNSEGKAEVANPEETEDNVQAIDNCPVGAISKE